MKKIKWALFLILPLVVLLATMQSGWAPGKATTNLLGLDIFDPTADGTKYFVRLTIHHVDSQDEILSPFEGKVLNVPVGVGDVEEGDPILVLEVETDTDTTNVEIPSPFGGVVQEIFVSEGDDVSVGEVMMTINCGTDRLSAPTKLLFFASATKGNEEITFSWEGSNVFCSKDEPSEELEFVNFGNALVEQLTGVDDATGIWNLKSVSDLVGERTVFDNDVVNYNIDGTFGPGFISMNLVLAVKD